MSYLVRDLLVYRVQTMGLNHLDAKRAVRRWTPVVTSEASGAHPTLVDVFRRHPDWRRRTRKIIRKNGRRT